MVNLGDTQYVHSLSFSFRAYTITSDSIFEITQKHDAVFDQERIHQAGGWVTTVCESTRPRLGSVMAIPTVTSPQSPRFSSPSNTFSPFSNSDVSVSPVESLPIVPTGPQRHVLHRSSSCRHYVNGELEVARSLGDFGFKLNHIWERKWRYPTERREQLGIDGFKANIVENVPFVR